jgi:hypothetical protein
MKYINLINQNIKKITNNGLTSRIEEVQASENDNLVFVDKNSSKATLPEIFKHVEEKI